MRSGLQWVEEYYEFDADGAARRRDDALRRRAGRHGRASPPASRSSSSRARPRRTTTRAARRTSSPRRPARSSAAARAACASWLRRAAVRPARHDQRGARVRRRRHLRGLVLRRRHRPRLRPLRAARPARRGVGRAAASCPRAGSTTAARPRSPDEHFTHGAHWWSKPDGRWGLFNADGFEGQRIYVVPELDLVLVRLGKTHTDHSPTMDAAPLRASPSASSPETPICVHEGGGARGHAHPGWLVAAGARRRVRRPRAGRPGAARRRPARARGARRARSASPRCTRCSATTTCPSSPRRCPSRSRSTSRVCAWRWSTTPAPRRVASGRMRRRFPDADVVVFGHSHIPINEPRGRRPAAVQPGLADRAPPPAAPHLRRDRPPRRRDRPRRDRRAPMSRSTPIRQE